MGSAAKRVRQGSRVLFGGAANRDAWRDVMDRGGASEVKGVMGSYQFTVYRSDAVSGQDVAEMKILIPRKGSCGRSLKESGADRHGRGHRLCPGPL